MSDLKSLASDLLRLHHTDETLVLPTVWDVWSARAVVDAGFPGQRDDVLTALATLGAGPANVRAILLTHAHGDHVGDTEAIARESGAELAIQRTDAQGTALVLVLDRAPSDNRKGATLRPAADRRS